MARTILGVCAAFATLTSLLPAQAAVTLLDCTFDDQPIDEPIAFGGADEGQPVSSQLQTWVRDEPFATPCLELVHPSFVSTQYTEFRFLHDWEIPSGLVEIELTMWLESLDEYSVLVRPSGSLSRFAEIQFWENGDIQVRDNGFPIDVATYQPGVALRLGFVVDLDQRRTTFLVDGQIVHIDDEWGSIGDDEGVGAVLVGYGHSSPNVGQLFLDRVAARASEAPTPIEATSWGDVKSMFSGK